MQVNGMLHLAFENVEISSSKIGFVARQWSNFSAWKVVHPLAVIQFWGPLWGAFLLHAGKGKCCMWCAKKVEIYFAKIGFVDWK